VLRSLTYYWRTNVAVVLGVATAVSVLAGALLVGDSVRGSLRDLLLGRLGRTDQVIASANLFREQLAADIARTQEFSAGFSGAAPLLIAQGMVTSQNEDRRVAQARVYGVDDRFWRFHSVANVSGPTDRQAFISPALGRQLGASKGDSILVRVQRPTDVPLESLHGQRDKVGRSVRLTVADILPGESLGEFSHPPTRQRPCARFCAARRSSKTWVTSSRRSNHRPCSSSAPPPAFSTMRMRAQRRRPSKARGCRGGRSSRIWPTAFGSVTARCRIR
jgi:hypothetical protein